MSKLWLIGAGGMSIEYYKVLKDLDCDVIVIGRGKESAKKFEELCNVEVFSGGLDAFLETKPKLPHKTIIAVNLEKLAESAQKVIEYGVKSVLLEKPGGLDKDELIEVKKVKDDNEAEVFIAYNRRFYSSVQKALEIIQKDGGVRSFNFEFTEWAHTIEPLPNPEYEKQKWFLGNSSHVVDLAFYIGGKPKEIASFTAGSLDWHNSSCVFSGSGISDTGALFSYHANWDSPGRWSVEILTKNHRLYFRPMEKLQIQLKGSVAVDFLDIDDSYDIKYKPGLFKQTETFVNGIDDERLCTLDEHLDKVDTYYKIANYS